MSKLLLLLSVFRGRLSKILYWNAPDILFALLNNIFTALYHILLLKKINVEEPVFVIPYDQLWMAYQKDRRIFVPSPREGFRLNTTYRGEVEKKYTFKPYVKVDPGDVVLDVGAYIGEFTIPVASKAKIVIAIEPDPRNFACLKRNTAHLKNVVLINKAAWSSKGSFYLHLGFSTTDSSLIGVSQKPLRKAIKVQADTLDNIASCLELSKLDFLKIDAEGAEPEVLEGAKNLLKVTEKVAIDCTPERWGKSTSLSCAKILKEAGFLVHITPSDIIFAYKV